LTISWCLKALKTIRYLNSDPTPNHIHRVSSRHGYDTSTGSSSKAQEWSKLSILCGTYKCCWIQKLLSTSCDNAQLKMKPIVSCEAHACMKYFVPQSTTQFANGESMWGEIIIFCAETFEPCVIWKHQYMASKKYVVSQGVANDITKLNIQQQLLASHVDSAN